MGEELSIIIISDARINSQVTLDCLNSLFSQDVYEIIVVESDPKTNYDKFHNVKTIHPDGRIPFNYNKFLNIGASYASGYYLAFCNNDLIFTTDWWNKLYHNMQKENCVSASPICPTTHKQFGYEVSDRIVYGKKIREHIAGWCLVLNRIWYISMGGFDERFTFWCADNSYGKQLEKHGKRHFLDCSSVVHHVESASLKKIPKDLHDEYTRTQVMKYNTAFNENLFNLKS